VAQEIVPLRVEAYANYVAKIARRGLYERGERVLLELRQTTDERVAFDGEDLIA
jgi:hypothetical protein